MEEYWPLWLNHIVEKKKLQNFWQFCPFGLLRQLCQLPWKLNRNGQDMLRDAEARVVTAPPEVHPPRSPDMRLCQSRADRRPLARSRSREREPVWRTGSRAEMLLPISWSARIIRAGSRWGHRGWSVMQGKAAATCDLPSLTCNQTQKYLTHYLERKTW